MNGGYKKSLLFFFILKIYLVQSNNETSNNTFVMKLNSANKTKNNNAHHRILLSKYNSERKGEVVRKKIKNVDVLKPVAELTFPQNLEIVEEILNKLNSTSCIYDTKTVLKAISKQEKWSLQMFDSFQKFPVGILYGNYYMLGNFDECIRAKEPNIYNTDDFNGVQGQYCLADIYVSKNGEQERFARSPEFSNSFQIFRRYQNASIIHWGICLPSSCTSADAAIFIKEIFNFATNNIKIVSVEVNEKQCYYEKYVPFNTLEIVYGCIIGFVLIFILIATGFHCWHLKRRSRRFAYNVESLRPKKNTAQEVIFCFSIVKTIQKFLHTKPSDLNLECVCGVKVLSMLLILSGHALIFALGGPIMNEGFFEKESVKVENGLFFNNPLLVDTFLLVSGFLMSRLLLIELDKRKGKISFLILYVARYIRLTPSYFVMLGLYCTIFYRLGEGPFWRMKVETEKERCLVSWWSNLLYVNNYVNTDNLCMFQAWYLAVDYHLFILAPFIIYPLWRWSRLGEFLLVLSAISAIAIPFWITLKDKLDPTFLVYPSEVQDLSTNYYFVNSYIKTHMRASSYCLGILFGYVVHRLQISGKKIPPYIIWIGWTVATVCGTLSMFSVVAFYLPNHQENATEFAIYAALHRVAWCVGVGWTLIVCVTDNAGAINKFLGWKLFIPLSRLTYCAYLTNGFIELYTSGVSRQPLYMSKYNLANRILGHISLTFAAAFVLCILFESPIHGLEKILLSKGKMKEQSSIARVQPVTDS